RAEGEAPPLAVSEARLCGRGRCTRADVHAGVRQNPLERREQRENLLAPARFTHQADPPDLPLERAEPAADLDRALGEEAAPQARRNTLFSIHRRRAGSTTNRKPSASSPATSAR